MELLNYLIDNRINKDNFRKLNNQFKTENFVPFLGAGLSIPTGEPDWENLLKKMQSSTSVKIRLQKDVNGNVNYPRCFSNLYRKMENKLNFYSHLFKHTEPTETSYTACHREIVSIFNSYITTNYDSIIEQVFEKDKNQKIKRHFFSNYDIGNLDNSIIYLHGHKCINYAILKEEDYDYFYPTVSRKNGIPIVESFLENIYKHKTLLFIGFSFSDKYIYSFLQYLASKNKEKTHFALINKNTSIYSEYKSRSHEYRKLGEKSKARKEENKFYESLTDLNIHSIVYNQNIFIEKLLEKLSTEKTLPDLKRHPITGEV